MALSAMLRGRSSAEQKARDGLRAAIDERRMAELALQSKNESVQRLEQIIAAAAAAEQAAAQAQNAAHAGAAAWAAAGAADGDTSHERMLEQVTERRRAADVAKVRAHGAQQAVPAAREAVEEAKRARDQAAERIPYAVGAVAMSLCEPDFPKLEQARRAYLEVYNRLRGVLEAEDREGWPPARHLAAGLGPVRDRLTELAMPKYAAWGSHSDAPGYDAERWTVLAKRLASDPDAVADG